MKDAYKEYIEKYKELNIYEKREEVIEKIRDILDVLGNFSQANEDLINREIIDLKKVNVSESDYLEGLFVYLNILEDSVANSIINLQEKK